MKKLLVMFGLVLFAINAIAQPLVMLPVNNQQQLNTLFQRSDLTIHFYNDDFVVATAEKLSTNMFVLDEKAFSDGNYYLVYCQKAAQESYLKDKTFKVLYSDDNRMIVNAKGTEMIPAQNDGLVAITNREAHLPRMTRDFPNVTEENPDIRFVLEQVSQDSMYATVAFLQAYRNRKWNTENAFAASDWIKSRFDAMGLETEQQPFVFSGQNAAPNVIAIQRGKLYPDTYVICGSHFDSFSYDDECPGADDNATGVASVLESARLLSQYDFDYSIIYCAFGCEELGLIGSAAYSTRCRQENMDIIGYFNNDMNGYLYGNEVHIHQIYPNSSEPCGAFYRNVGQVYYPAMVIEKKNFSAGDSDHTSFNQNGYQGIYPFEDVNHYSPYIHTFADTIGLSVNSWLMPQRYCQMNIACLAEVAGMHKRGPVVLKSFEISDEGNQNGKMNPGEDIWVTVTVQNVFDYAVNNVYGVVDTENEYIQWYASETDFGDFAPGEEKTFEAAFGFHLAAEAPAPANYRFDMKVANEDESCRSLFDIQAYASVMDFVDVVVLDDNGMLEPGETAEIRFLFENIGNEMADEWVGVLSSESEWITLNETEGHFQYVLPNDMTYADFSVTLSADAPAGFAIPFVLTAESGVYEIIYKNACNVVFTLEDAYGDGWNGASLIVDFNDGTPSETMTISNGAQAVYTLEIATGVEVSLRWQNGSWDNECSYSVAYENGTVIYSGTGAQNGVFFSWTTNCSGSGNASDFCGTVQNLSHEPESLIIIWDAPLDAEPDSYDVYRSLSEQEFGPVFLGNTTETRFEDDANTVPGEYYYCVYPVFDGCQGEMDCHLVNYDPLDVVELAEQISIYPNPAKGQLTLSVNEKAMVEIINLQGQKMMDFTVSGEKTLDVSQLSAGIYFVKILGSKTYVKKVVIEK